MPERKKSELASELGNATDIVFSFDTTGSMRPVIASVRAKIEETCEELFEDIDGLRIGLIAHGDYCDGENCLQMLPLTNDKARIFDFIRNTPNTGGGDAPECYELALRKARDMGWQGEGGVLVMIGDDEPHPPEYAANEMNLDWRQELGALDEMGISVYPMQCLFSEHSAGRNSFWQAIAEVCDTALIRLDDLNEGNLAFNDIAYAAAGEDAFAAYESKLAASGTTVTAETAARRSTLKEEATKFKGGYRVDK